MQQTNTGWLADCLVVGVGVFCWFVVGWLLVGRWLGGGCLVGCRFALGWLVAGRCLVGWPAGWLVGCWLVVGCFLLVVNYRNPSPQVLWGGVSEAQVLTPLGSGHEFQKRRSCCYARDFDACDLPSEARQMWTCMV